LPEKTDQIIKKENAGELEEPSYTITEGNLFYHHFASVGTLSKERKKLVSVVIEEQSNAQGAKQVRQWKVKGDVELGYPSWLDEKVFIAVLDIARRQGYPVHNPVRINISELCRTVALDPKSGRNRNMVRTSLQRIASTRIEAKDAFFYKEEKAFVDYTFAIFQDVTYAELRMKDEKATGTVVWLSDRVLSNINNGYVRLIDTKLFMKLVPIAGRLYELLSSRFFGLLSKLKEKGLKRDGNYVIENYETLCNRIPLRQYKKKSKAIQQFSKAHDQLLQTGFLAKVEWMDDNSIRYYPGEKAIYDFDNALKEITRQIDLPFAAKRDKLTLQLEGPEDGENREITLKLIPEGMETPPVAQSTPEGLKFELIDRGITKIVAGRLIKNYEENRIREKIELFDYLKANNSQQLAKNPAGYLRKAIEEDYSPPEGFTTREQREERAKKAKDAERQRLTREKEQDFEKWLKLTDKGKIAGQLMIWEFRFKKEHNRPPSAEEKSAREEELIAKIPNPEKYKKDLFQDI